MSFASDVKNEIASSNNKPCCDKALLASLIKINGTLSLSSGRLSLVIRTENSNIAKLVFKLVKQIYDVRCEFAVTRKMKLKKNIVYLVRIHEKAREIMEDLHIMSEKGFEDKGPKDLVKKECCAKSYLKGSFLACGSVNSPITPNYHLEISCVDLEHAQFVLRLLKRFNIIAKTTKRRNNTIVYLKESEKISDFLKIIEANQAVFIFEDAIVQRKFMNRLTRIDNCEIANEMKTLNASATQVEDIKLIDQVLGIDSLDEKIGIVAKLRLEHLDATLNELCSYYYEQTETEVSKSGMNHRMRKIHEIADRLRNKGHKLNS